MAPGSAPLTPTRRGAPIWVVVVVGLFGLLIGGGIGGVAGFFAGAASQLADSFGGAFDTAEPGADAEVGSGPVDAARIDVGQFAVTDLDVQPDIADDFIALLTLTNDGPDWDGGAISVEFFAGDRFLGSVSGSVPPLSSGESVDLEVWGFDPYDASFDRVEVRIGQPIP